MKYLSGHFTRHVQVQKAHEKMINIINQNANKSYHRYHFPPTRMAVVKKTTIGVI